MNVKPADNIGTFALGIKNFRITLSQNHISVVKEFNSILVFKKNYENTSHFVADYTHLLF